MLEKMYLVLAAPLPEAHEDIAASFVDQLPHNVSRHS
jgi:hypothetical protein